MKQSERTFILFARDGASAWRVASCDGASTVWQDVGIDADAAADQRAAAAVEALRQLEPGAATGVTLAIPSAWCLCAAVDGLDPAGRSARREAMLYRLEEQLPLAAEEFVADFIGADDHRTAMGVAAPLATLEPLVRAIESRGWTVDAIAPAALLAAQGYLDSGALPKPCDAILFAHDGKLELLELAGGGRLSGWGVLPVDAEDVALEIGLRALHHHGPLHVACAGVPGEVVERLERVAELKISPADLPAPPDAAARTAHAVARDGATSWVQLRRDALGAADRFGPARRAMKAAAIAAALFVACFCAAMIWRASAYRQMAAAAEAEQREIFSAVFDGKRVAEGVNVASRLASEERRLRALAGESLELPSRPSALVLLQRVLARLPEEARCQVDELRLEEDKLYVEGTAPSHADAAMFVTALETDDAFDVESPRTAQLAGGDGVSMIVTGKAGAHVVAAPVGPATPAAGRQVMP